MALRICQDCTTPFAVGVSLCPHCGSERHIEQGSDPYRGGNDVPKITRHGGASFAPEQELQGTGQPMTPVEVPADGTWSEPIEGDESGEALPPADAGDLSAQGASEGGVREEEPSPRPTAEGTAGKLDNAAVREWARSQGIEVSPRGKIPADVVEAYREAHPADSE